MTGQEHQRRPESKTDTEATAGAVGSAALKKASEAGETLKAELDELLDDIDEVLEENAEEFVRGYVQKGGQ